MNTQHTFNFEKGKIYSRRDNFEIIGYEQSRGYLQLNVEGSSKLKHVYLYEQFHGIKVPKDAQIDHIDGNKLNNAINNLRMVDKYQNNQNKRRRTDNKSGYPGVTELPNGKFKSQISAKGKKYYLGTFTDKQSAIKARRDMEAQLNDQQNCCFNTEIKPSEQTSCINKPSFITNHTESLNWESNIIPKESSDLYSDSELQTQDHDGAIPSIDNGWNGECSDVETIYID